MDDRTRYRDTWAEAKQVALADVFRASATVTTEIGRGTAELERLVQQLARSISFRDFYAGVERLAEVSRSIVIAKRETSAPPGITLVLLPMLVQAARNTS